ncbi:acyl transferase/acyl hydrolase/lysophospholipase, partial [Copromyces sp. CBS 386.78]
MPPGENDPINLLALDGGGIRGVSELIILDKIMKRVQEIEGLSEIPKPCDYFHIMGGVSTGGLVAILLGRFRMSTTEALAQYDIFAKSIFRRANRRHFGVAISSKFHTEPLVAAVKGVTQEHGSGELLRDPVERPLGKAFVCAMPNVDQGVARRFRTYSSDDDWDKNVEIWQAARATTAAPGYFEPMTIKGGGENPIDEVFIDAAMGLNNPADEVLNEAGLRFHKSSKLGCLLSLGTGTRIKTLKFAHGLKFAKNAVTNMKEIVTSSETVHVLLEGRFKNFTKTYFRFSVPDAAETIPMDDYKKMKPLKVMTEEYLNAQAKERIEEVAQILAKRKTENLTIKQATTSMEKNDVIVEQASRSQPRGQVSNFFTGRLGTLAKMHKYFFGTQEESQRPRKREFLLWGMGGVGKSQVALKFYEEHVDKFKYRFWVDATNLTTLKEGYIRIGRELWPGTEPTASNDAPVNETAANEALILRVTKWMEEYNQDWLLILDNIAADREWSEWLPRGGHARVIYTSREKNAKRELRSDAIAEVNTLSEANAVTLLLRAADKGDHNDRMLRTGALPIVRELGCLPLALDQAGHYLAVEKNTTLEDYLFTFKEKKTQMLSSGNKEFKGSSLLQQSVYTTFDISYTQLLFWEMSGNGHETSMGARVAIKLLKTICFYYHENIKQEIFKRTAEWRAQRNDDPLRVTTEEIIKGDKDKIVKHTYSLDEILRVDAANKFLPQDLERGLRVLQSLSLLKPTHEKGTYSMHVLVHDWARNRMHEFERQGYCLLARRILLCSIPTSKHNPGLIKYRRSVLSHAMACVQFAKENRVFEGNPSLEQMLQYRYALMAQEAADWEKAEETWKDVLRDIRAEYTGDEEDFRLVLPGTLRLAELYSELARFGEAERLLVEVLELMEGEYGHQSEEAIKAREGLKDLY